MFKRLYYILLQRAYVLFHKNRPDQGRVYMFHNVNDDADTYSIKKDNFELFLNYLCQNKKIVDIETLIKEKDSNNVVITFDDVYESVFKNAYPLLKERGVPFYLFICDEYLNQEKYVNSDMIKEMLKESKAILGSHRMKHELSRLADANEIKEDLSQSKKKLEKEFGVSVNFFAFPYGSMYACSDRNTEDALSLFDYVFMTYAIPYNEEYENVIPRINMNDASFRKEM